MPLAMAESLEANIVLFRTDNDKTFFVTPQVTSTHRTLFLVYHPHGSGHYDAALVFQTPPLTTTKPIKCSCGVNKKEQSNSCSKKIHYISRCKQRVLALSRIAEKMKPSDKARRG